MQRLVVMVALLTIGCSQVQPHQAPVSAETRAEAEEAEEPAPSATCSKLRVGLGLEDILSDHSTPHTILASMSPILFSSPNVGCSSCSLTGTTMTLSGGAAWCTDSGFSVGCLADFYFQGGKLIQGASGQPLIFQFSSGSSSKAISVRNPSNTEIIHVQADGTIVADAGVVAMGSLSVGKNSPDFFVCSGGAVASNLVSCTPTGSADTNSNMGFFGVGDAGVLLGSANSSPIGGVYSAASGTAYDAPGTTGCDTGTTITVAGVNFGDQCAAGATDSVAAEVGVYQADVSSANNVKVRFCTPVAATNPASHTFKPHCFHFL